MRDDLFADAENAKAVYIVFTTFERVEETPLIVVKKDGTREQFSKEKNVTRAD
ncbi:hypothetical protein GCM10020331_032770 [Ectobacillus funiculus]